MGGNSILLITGLLFAGFAINSCIKKFDKPQRSGDRFSGLIGIIFWGLAIFFMLPHLK